METMNYKTTIRKRKLKLLEEKYYNFLCENLEHINNIDSNMLNKCVSYEKRINSTRKNLKLNPVKATDIIKANAKMENSSLTQIEKLEEQKISMLKRKQEIRERKYFDFLTEMFKDVSKISEEDLEKCKIFEERVNKVRESLNLSPVTAFDILSVGANINKEKVNTIEK